MKGVLFLADHSDIPARTYALMEADPTLTKELAFMQVIMSDTEQHNEQVHNDDERQADDLARH